MAHMVHMVHMFNLVRMVHWLMPAIQRLEAAAKKRFRAKRCQLHTVFWIDRGRQGRAAERAVAARPGGLPVRGLERVVVDRAPWHVPRVELCRQFSLELFRPGPRCPKLLYTVLNHSTLH